MAEDGEFAFYIKEVGSSFIWALFEGAEQTKVSSEESFASAEQAAQDAKNFQVANYPPDDARHDAPVFGGSG
jgi:hypothetical protein